MNTPGNWEADEILRSEQKRFEKWLLDEHGLVATWDQQRNCYAEFPAHLAWKAWRYKGETHE